ncbi:RHS repeat-associated protein [Flavobacterium arsenatis]|uniref:RHS repeat-associated protein n=1 Tax=Flavobacterium arsenatis TaxID=1484332 RepID=A0ABU1TTF3_9FLAO|nr:DUF6443 domain-containing protein [Flavobacterium arsenatis]MDR6969107.1 RHS repeat-associated protein [Flavobacterium arsenatis]
MKSINILLCLLPMIALAQSTDQNHIKNITYKQAVSIPLSNPTPAQASVGVTYFDGLGRPMQQVLHKQSSSGMDVVTPILYDDYGRQTREYLPIPASSSNMLFTSNSSLTSSPSSHYTTNYGTDASFAYSEKRLEASPLGRILEQGAPGMAWKVLETSDQDHTIKFEYKTNGEGEVRLLRADASWIPLQELYNPSPVTRGYYDPNTLYKTITKDENWTSGLLNTTVEFKNRQGQVVLKRTYNDPDNTNTAIAHDTYYLYDQFGNLSFVLPPMAEGNMNEEILEKLCYQYKYDSRNRLVEKKLPGKQWEFILYDRQDRVVATGPAHSPFNNISGMGWLINKYDALGRPMLTGWLASSTIHANGRATLQKNTLNLQTVFNESKTSTNTTINAIPFRYTNLAWPTAGYHVLTVNYYDDYAFPNAPTVFSIVMDGIQQVQYNNTTLKPVGLPTGSWTRVLTGSSSTSGETSYVLYDKKGRAVRNHTANYLGGYTYTDTKLDFSGKATYSTTYHKRSSGDELITREEFTYSDQDLLMSHNHKITFPGYAGVAERLSSNEYDALGQLKSKHVGGPATNPTGLQKVDFSYNIRGWLKGINNTLSFAESGFPNDLFAFRIGYNEVEGMSTPLFNGNISETYWKTHPENTLRKYSYEYDDLNRLTDAYYQKPGLTQPYTAAYNEEIGYDKNGNIRHLYRNGYRDGDTSYSYNIDDLNYLYDHNSNVLRRVDDKSYSLDGFLDGNINKDFNPTHFDHDYEYDDNGNMTADWNKGIERIDYNHLNLPTKITFRVSAGQKNITYIYNALGQKMLKHVLNQSPDGEHQNVVTEYLGGYQYIAGVLEFFPTSEGYVRVTNGNIFNYVYNYTDHLGNIRLSYTNDDNTAQVLEENHYYPFGMRHSYNRRILDWGGSIGTGGIYAIVQPVRRSNYQYKYNGKEYQDELSLNWYDYGARNYDPALGRFFNIDRMAEMFERMTPYQYAGNTPTYFIDRNGEYIDINDPNGTDKYRYQNGQTQKRQADGSYKTIDASENLSDFVLQTIAGLNGLENSGKTGKGMIDAFSGDKKNVTFEYTQGQAPEANRNTGIISLDPTSANKSWTTEGYIATPLFVTLGHEMEHIASKNSSNYDTWYKPGVFKAEIGATHVENKIRAESGLPLRTHYGGNSKGAFAESRLIDNQGNSIYYNIDGGRYLYPNTPQTQQTQATINDVNKANKGVILNSRYNYNENR